MTDLWLTLYCQHRRHAAYCFMLLFQQTPLVSIISVICIIELLVASMQNNDETFRISNRDYVFIRQYADRFSFLSALHNPIAAHEDRDSVYLATSRVYWMLRIMNTVPSNLTYNACSFQNLGLIARHDKTILIRAAQTSNMDTRYFCNCTRHKRQRFLLRYFVLKILIQNRRNCNCFVLRKS